MSTTPFQQHLAATEVGPLGLAAIIEASREGRMLVTWELADELVGYGLAVPVARDDGHRADTLNLAHWVQRTPMVKLKGRTIEIEATPAGVRRAMAETLGGYRAARRLGEALAASMSRGHVMWCTSSHAVMMRGSSIRHLSTVPDSHPTKEAWARCVVDTNTDPSDIQAERLHTRPSWWPPGLVGTAVCAVETSRLGLAGYIREQDVVSAWHLLPAAGGGAHVTGLDAWAVPSWVPKGRRDDAKQSVGRWLLKHGLAGYGAGRVLVKRSGPRDKRHQPHLRKRLLEAAKYTPARASATLTPTDAIAWACHGARATRYNVLIRCSDAGIQVCTVVRRAGALVVLPKHKSMQATRVKCDEHLQEGPLRTELVLAVRAHLGMGGEQ
jgi:hypothetical protein